MSIYLNIDVWQSGESIYVKEPKDIEATFIKAGTPIPHERGMFIRRIADLKIIFSGDDLPKIDRNSDTWRWEGLASRKVLKKLPAK
jgi:hypothetical protein